MTANVAEKVPNRAAQLGRAGIAVAAATVVANFLAYLVPLFGARKLDAGNLSAIATVMAILAIASVPALGLQMAVAVGRAKHGAVHRLNRLILLAVAATVIPLLLLTPVLSHTLRLPWQVVPFAAVTVAAVTVASGWLGVLQGSMRFSRLALGMVLLGITRCGGIIAGLLAGFDLVGMVALGAAVSVLATAAIRPLLPPPVDLAEPPPMLSREVWAAGSATLALFVLSYADLIAARYLLPDVNSAEYAVLNVLTKGAIWAPGVITVMALPYFARDVRNSRKLAVLAVTAFGALLVAGTALLGPLAMRAAGGEAYVHLAGYAPAFAALGALYAIVFVLTNAQVAGGAKSPAAPLWVVAAGFTTAVLVLRPGITGIVTCALAAAAASVIGVGVALHLRTR
ncbi:polysaccharide biosynthesis protein [Rhizocola hellebori]|uniref:Polysaccharide biosynthesis protein n=1 Tax=Rhizocola hellebori TaxID=1392758 RepID=A0A8J3VKC2_9ACTN|nr:polysaccharide biosynthesis protein [Rhizocola hellebori]GIH09387.1 polysaccharide biosynthesis protein [Rhizocola hellebori]